ncbi:MAG: cell division protein FtsZ, partial [Polaromonas sp.]
MSTLQISLAVAGGLVLAGVVAHSAWSTRKNLPKQASPRESAAEPSLTAGAAPPQEDGALAERQEPSFDTDSGLPALTQLTALEKKTGLDVLIDSMAAVALESVVSGEAALAAMPGTRRVGSKPFGVEGLSVITGEWEFPTAGHRYSAFQCGVQLANRTGALNQIEYSEFVITTQAFADALDGQAEFPEMQDEVARARELDQFASAHDAQLSFTLRANRTAWSPGYVQQSAAKLGFVTGAIPGRMVLPANQQGHAPILGLSFDTQAAMADDPEQTA